MLRRDFLKTAAAASLLPSLSTAAIAKDARYDGKLVFSIFADGGWDTSSFCDPKKVTSINNWAKKQDIQRVKNSPITYAPFADNEAFFQKYAKDMLVLNGIDCQTNAHNAGAQHFWSGRFGPGYPGAGPMAAFDRGLNLPLPYLSFGDYQETAGLVVPTIVESEEGLRQIVDPNNAYNEGVYFQPENYTALQNYRAKRLQSLGKLASNNSPWQQSLDRMQRAFDTAPQLKRLEASLNDLPEQEERNRFNIQVDVALAAAHAGILVSADLVAPEFDTHDNHDATQTTALTRLTQGIDHFWTVAEKFGLSDRIILVVGSEFSRTPEYNDGNGKDHWPIGSAIFMAKNASWTNHVIGGTDDGQNARFLSSNLTTTDNESDVILQPKHVQALSRQLAGLEGKAVTRSFPLFDDDLDIRQVLG